jgi:Arc/MetJ-type ribon-helix-helix transcriptional regulator
MTKQLAVRFPDELLEELDEAIGLGAAENRSSAIVVSMKEWLDRERRKRLAGQIVAEYKRLPQTPEEIAWVRAASEASIAAEPW